MPDQATKHTQNNMLPIPIFTSIPPIMSRKTIEGDEIGTDYQAACIASWLSSGFTPFTLNSSAETLSENAVAKTAIIRLEKDAPSL